MCNQPCCSWNLRYSSTGMSRPVYSLSLIHIYQNYVPVIDDQGFFIGIITRKEIIKYCYKELKAAYADRQTDSPAQENN